MKRRNKRNKERRRRRRLQGYYDFVIWLARNTPWQKQGVLITAWKNVRKKAERDIGQNILYGYINNEVLKLEDNIDDIGTDKCMGVMKHHCGKYYYLNMI